MTEPNVDRLSDVIAENIKLERMSPARRHQHGGVWIQSRGLTQQDLAKAMSDLGFGWTRVTVTEVESGKRRVTVDELIGLALVFSRPLAALLVPVPWDIDGTLTPAPDVAVVPRLVLSPRDLTSVIETGLRTEDSEADIERDALVKRRSELQNEKTRLTQERETIASQLREVEADLKARLSRKAVAK